MQAKMIGILAVVVSLAGCVTGGTGANGKEARDSGRQTGVEKVCHQYNDPVGNPAYENCVREYQRGGYVETSTGVRR